MSNAALTWAFPLPLKGPPKGVLIALANHADDSGHCYPSVQRLALFSGFCERVVRKSIHFLAEAGFIRISPRQGCRHDYYLALSPEPYDMGACDAPLHDDPKTPPISVTTPARSVKTPAPDAPKPSETSENHQLTIKRDRQTEAIEIWNLVCGPFGGVVKKMTEPRKASLAARLRDCTNDIAQWRAYCEKIADSEFLSGSNDRGWVATFDWAIKQSNMTKVAEEKYGNRRKINGHQTGAQQVLGALGDDLTQSFDDIWGHIGETIEHAP